MPEAKSKSKRKRHSSILEIEVIRKRGADGARVLGDAAPTPGIRLAGKRHNDAKAAPTEKPSKNKAKKEARKRADDIRREAKKAKDRERARVAAEADRIRRKEAAKRIEEYLAWQTGAASDVGPADESSPRPSPYTIRERERRAAYEAWLLEQQAGAAAVSTQPGDPGLDGNAVHPAPGAPTPPATSDLPVTDPPPTSATSVAPAADAGVVILGVEAQAEAAFSVVPYRGPRSLRDLIAGDPPAMSSTPAAAVQKTKTPAAKPSTKPMNAPAPAAPGEIRAKRLADTVPTIIRVSADRRLLQRMTPVQREAFFRDREAQRIGAMREVKCGGGWCDLLTKEEIVEVKAGRFWRHALGQVLCYGTYWPDRHRRIHLFDVGRQHAEEAGRICTAYGVQVSIAAV